MRDVDLLKKHPLVLERDNDKRVFDVASGKVTRGLNPAMLALVVLNLKVHQIA